MICAVKDLATVGGLSVGPATSPRRRSFLSIPRMLKPTLSPGSACGICSWCISIDFTSPTLSAGMKWTFIPTFRSPVSTRPTGTVPAPVIEYTSWTGRRSGRFVGFGGTVSWFNASTRASLVPRHLGRRLHDVLALVRADRDEGDLVDLVADALQEGEQFRLQLGVPRLREGRLRRVQLGDRRDELLHAERAGEDDVFFRLRLHAIRRSDDEDGR